MTVDSAIDAVFGFVWRWFWRIVLWGIAAIIALYALAMLYVWASENPERWAEVFFGGLLGLIASLLFDVRRLLSRLVQQNDALLAKRTPSPEWDDS